MYWRSGLGSKIIWRFGFWLAVSLAILVMGCSGGGGSGGGVTDPPPDVEPLYEETSAAIDDAMAVVSLNLASMEISEAMEAAALAMLGHDCVSSAVCVDEAGADPYLVAEFSNGIVFTLPVVRLGTTLGGKSAGAAEVSPATLRSEHAGDRENELPANSQAIFFDLPDFTTDVARWVEMAENAGYNAVYLSSFTVESFKNLDAYGLVYLSSHGHLWTYRTDLFYSWSTPQVRNTASDLAFIRDGDFQDISVLLQGFVYIVANEDPYASENITYEVTHKYIEKYSGAFPENSFFFADACQSTLHYTMGEMPLVDTLLGMNTGTVLGWNRSVDVGASRRAGNYLMGLMLGDLSGGLEYVPVLDPPIRPYSLLNAFTALQAYDWHFDSQGVELLLFGAAEMILRPSINQLIVDVDLEQETETLKLLGYFGNRAGALTFCEDPEFPDSGDQISWTNWEDDEIMADLDGTSAGYVVVEVDGRKSNAHPLSRWEGEMSVSGTVPSGVGPNIELTLNTSWRAEIVGERGNAWEDPIPASGWAVALFGLESNCDYEFSGIFEDENYIYEYPNGANTGNMAASLNGTEMFIGVVTIKADQGTAFFTITFAREALVMKTDKNDPSGIPEADMMQVTIAMMFNANCNPHGVISSGEQAFPYNLSWPDMAPEYPPLGITAR